MAQLPFVIMTNGGGVTEHERAEFLSNTLNVPIRPDQVLHKIVADDILRR